jgi:hypothetical protein
LAGEGEIEGTTTTTTSTSTSTTTTTTSTSTTTTTTSSTTTTTTTAPPCVDCYQYEYINNGSETIALNGTLCEGGAYSINVIPTEEGTTLCIRQLSQGTIDAYAALGLVLTQGLTICGNSCGTTTTTTTTLEPTTTTTTTTVAPTTTTTTSSTTAAPCDCFTYDVIIGQEDLDDATGNTDPGKDNGIVYVEYTNCEGIPTTSQYSVANTYLNSICVDTTALSPTIYYYKDNTQSAPLTSSISITSNDCCVQ